MAFSSNSDEIGISWYRFHQIFISRLSYVQQQFIKMCCLYFYLSDGITKNGNFHVHMAD